MEHLNEIIPVVFNFLVMVGLLFLATRKSFAAFLVTRSEQVGGEILEADRLWKQANEELKMWEGKWKGVGAEAEKSQREAKDFSEKLSKSSIEKAQVEADRIRKEGDLVGKTELSRTQNMLRAEVAHKSIAAASQFLKDSLVEEDRRGLIKEYVEIVGNGSTR